MTQWKGQNQWWRWEIVPKEGSQQKGKRVRKDRETAEDRCTEMHISLWNPEKNWICLPYIAFPLACLNRKPLIHINLLGSGVQQLQSEDSGGAYLSRCRSWIQHGPKVEGWELCSRTGGSPPCHLGIHILKQPRNSIWESGLREHSPALPTSAIRSHKYPSTHTAGRAARPGHHQGSGSWQECLVEMRFL